MATAKFFTTAKRHNSTLIPTGGTDINVYLKDGSDLLTPVFKLNYSGVPSWSMMQFEGRYYFITDIASIRQDLWEITAAVDVLATYKADIQATTSFVLYDATANNDIIDSRLAVNTSETTVINRASFAPGLLTATGKIALSVVGNNTTSTYIITDTQLRQILNSTDVKNAMQQPAVYGDVDTDYSQTEALPDGTEIETYVKIGEWLKTLTHSVRQNTVILMSGNNPLECLRSAIWYPWDIVGDGAPENIYLGLVDTRVTASPVVNKVRGGSVTVNIPWQATDWRRNAPYHQIYLYIPFVGTTQLSVSDLIGKTSLTVGWAMNKLTGEMNVQVTTNTGEIIGVYNAQTAVSIPVGVSNVTPRQALSSIIAGAGAIASAVGGNMIGAAALAAQSISAISPQITCIGGASGGAAIGLELDVVCYSVFHDTSAEPNTIASVIGTPTMAHHSLAQKSGYVQTQDASVSGSMTDTERNAINTLLDGGIYIE